MAKNVQKPREAVVSCSLYYIDRVCFHSVSPHWLHGPAFSTGFLFHGLGLSEHDFFCGLAKLLVPRK